MRNIYRLLLIIITLFLIGCGATLPKVKPFKIDIQQGNVVTSEMLLQLRPGMTKSQVKFIMGTPLLVDSFRTNRWDYFYQLRQQGKIVKQHRVILDFENDLLKRVRGDVVPKGQTVEDVTKKLQEEAKQKESETPPVATGTDDLKVEAIEAPDAEVTDQLIEDKSSVQDDDGEIPPSVVAVPLAEQLVPTVEPEPIAAPEVKDLATEEEQSTIEKVEPAENVESVEKTESAAVPVGTMAKPAPDVPQNLPQPNSGKRVFRLDRSLDTSRIKPHEVETGSAVKEVVDSAKDSIPEAEPSFFERMLEKIGF